MNQYLLPHLDMMGLRLRVPPELLPRLLVGLLDGLALQHYVEPGVINASELEQAALVIAGALLEPVPAA